MKKKKGKKGFFIRYFDDFWFDTIGSKLEMLTILPLVFLPLILIGIAINIFHKFPLFWILFSGLTLILSEIIYLQFVKSEGGNLTAWKIGAIFGALHIIGIWLLLPLGIIKLLTKVPYSRIWQPCLIVIGIAGLIFLYFWINVMIGKKVRKTNGERK